MTKNYIQYPAHVLRQIVLILHMIRFSHTVFAMPFALIGAVLAGHDGAGGFCGWGKMTLIVLCMFFARSSAMTFNRIADADVDARNPRTAGRAIPMGQIARSRAWAFLIVCATLFVLITALFWKSPVTYFGYGNLWPMLFSIPTLVFICGYSYTKRFTWLSHFWLGASLTLAPAGAWVAISPPTGPITDWPVGLLGGAVLFWTAGFDIIYACQDVAVDRRDGLHALPARFGIPRALWVSRACHLIALVLLAVLMRHPKIGLFFSMAWAASAVLIAIEHWLVRRGEMTHIKIAFGTLNGLVSLLLAGAAIGDILRAG